MTIECLNYYFQTIFLLVIFTFVNSHNLHGFDDSVLFKLNWLERVEDDTFKQLSEESVVIKTGENEKYKCFLPNVEKKETQSSAIYDGPSPILLLNPLFSANICAYKLESYWTYEICHGKYVRQYHEDQEGKKVKVQEYFLGQWDETIKKKMIVSLTASENDRDKNKNAPAPTKKIEGVQLPYFEVIMEGGTLCDLNNKPRLTKVLYICYMPSNNGIYSIKEISTCEYEVIILTPNLCAHPRYKPQESEENPINCYPLDDAPQKPRSMKIMEEENLTLMQKRRAADEKKVYAVFKIDKDEQSGEARVKVEMRPMSSLGDDIFLKNPEKNKDIPQISSFSDTSPVESFLEGIDCLNGGTGWWKYEFCYGRYVRQYHVEKDGTKFSLNLGVFNKDEHLAWLEKNPHKRPKPLHQRKQLSHFYSEGSVCDKTGKPRQTEVKLKCLENSSSPGAVQLYLLEPKYCEYILGVESPLICDILSKADGNGLIDIPKTFSKFDEKNEESPATKQKDLEVTAHIEL